MTRHERLVVVATAGLAVAAVGTWMPWARIGGRNRSGFDTADTFIGLAERLAPGWVVWVGRVWYLPAFLVLAAWASTFGAGRKAHRVVALVALGLAAAIWVLYLWAGYRWDLFEGRLGGPIVTVVGIAMIAASLIGR